MTLIVARNFMHTRSTRRVWVLFILAPMILFICFAPFMASISRGNELSREQIFSLMEEIAWAPSTVGFSVILCLTRYMAKRDGLSLHDLGLTVPDWKNVFIGTLIGIGLSIICQVYVYPAMSANVNTFDPALRNTPALPAIVMFLAATISENTLYRGYAFGVLGHRYGFPLSMIICSLFNSLLVPAHAWQLFAFAFVLGLLLCAVRLLSNSLWMTIACHFTLSMSAKLIEATK